MHLRRRKHINENAVVAAKRNVRRLVNCYRNGVTTPIDFPNSNTGQYELVLRSLKILGVKHEISKGTKVVNDKCVEAVTIVFKD